MSRLLLASIIVTFATHAAAKSCSAKCSNDDLVFTSPKGDARLSGILNDIKDNAGAVLAVQKEVTDVVNTKVADLESKMDAAAKANEAAMTKTQQTLDDALATAVAGVNSDVSNLETDLKKSVAKMTADLGLQDAKLEQLRSSVVSQLQAKIDEVAKQAQNSANALYGLFSATAAPSCKAIKSKNTGATDGLYFLIINNEVFQAECKTVANQFVSLGGNGKSKNSAAASCDTQLIINNNDATKWIDPDSTADNPSNAVSKGCIDGKSAQGAGDTCGHLRKLGVDQSGTYWVKYGQNARRVYCDQKTDGGGWILIGTQAPNGQFRTGNSQKDFVSGPTKAVNQRYPQSFIKSISSISEYQVMVEENGSRDRNHIMMYKMEKNYALPLGTGNLQYGTRFNWHIGGGRYKRAHNNAHGCWMGVSVHGGSFSGFSRSQRCTNKADFGRTGGTNGDYKLDHCGRHTGTTRCFHGSTAIGVAHYIRTCVDAKLVGVKGKC